MSQREMEGPKASAVTGYKGGKDILNRLTSNVKGTSCSSRGLCHHLLAYVGIYTPIIHINQNFKNSVLWWHIPLIPALGRQRQEDLCEFKTSLVYRGSSRTARAVYTEKSCLGKKKPDMAPAINPSTPEAEAGG